MRSHRQADQRRHEEGVFQAADQRACHPVRRGQLGGDVFGFVYDDSFWVAGEDRGGLEGTVGGAVWAEGGEDLESGEWG